MRLTVPASATPALAAQPGSRFRSIVITGASSGLGAALARHFAGPGIQLLLVARHTERLAQVAATCEARGAGVTLALSDVRDHERLATALHEHDARHPVDLVIANAGIEAGLGPRGEPEPRHAASAQIAINLEGALATVTPLLGVMQARRGGAIVLVSSLAALAPLPDQPAYSASKAGLLAWGEAARPWLAAFGIQVTVACPGFIRSGMSDGFDGWRPLEWPAERAARRIADAVARKQAVVAFPWPLVLLIRLGRLVPRRVREMVLTRFFAAKIRPDPDAG